MFDLNNLFSVFIGGLLALVGVYWQHRMARKTAEANEKRKIKALLQAFHDELQTLWGLYMKAVGTKLEEHEDDKPFLFFWTVYQDYFTVFNSNAAYIGEIEDETLRKTIIVAYNQARAVLDSFQVHNKTFADYERLLLQVSQVGTNEQIQNICSQALIHTTKALKEAHKSACNEVNHALYLLKAGNQ